MIRLSLVSRSSYQPVQHLLAGLSVRRLVDEQKTTGSSRISAYPCCDYPDDRLPLAEDLSVKYVVMQTSMPPSSAVPPDGMFACSKIGNQTYWRSGRQ